MTSSVYECQVMHRRLKPEQKRFDYRIFMLSIDLDAIPNIPLLGHNRFNLFSLNDADHIDLGKPGGIKPNLLAWLAEQSIDVPADVNVRLVTLPRMLGYGFNPVSFFYLTNPDGSPLFAVAEVVNTYREMKLYLVDQKGDASWQKQITKNFYVSPFSDSGDAFDFHLGLPAENLRVTINNLTDHKVTLTSTVRGTAYDLTSTRLLLYSLSYPLLTLKIITMIHWQALKLWAKKVRYFKKTDRLEAQTEVLRPHSSLSKNHDL